MAVLALGLGLATRAAAAALAWTAAATAELPSWPDGALLGWLLLVELAPGAEFSCPVTAAATAAAEALYTLAAAARAAAS
jgi:hypothetical protein